MKNQALFSLKDKSKKLKCRLLQFLFGALRVNIILEIKFLCLLESYTKDKHSPVNKVQSSKFTT